MFRTVFPSVIRSTRLYIQQQVYVIQVLWLLARGHEMELQFHLVPASKHSTNLYDIYLTLCVQSWTPDDGRKDRPKHVEWYSINSKKLCIWLVLFITMHGPINVKHNSWPLSGPTHTHSHCPTHTPATFRKFRPQVWTQYTNGLLYMYIQGSPVEIQTPAHRNLIGRCMTALLPMPTPSSILPSPPPHCVIIPAMRFATRLF